jgi:hypothetical protein
MSQYTLSINGQARQVDVAPHTPLLRVLRDSLHHWWAPSSAAVQALAARAPCMWAASLRGPSDTGVPRGGASPS